MKHNLQKAKLAKDLLSKLDVLVDKWLDYFNQKNITRLASENLYASALECYYGLGFNYVEVKCIKDTLDILHLLFETPQNRTLKSKVELVDKELNDLFNIFESYFESSPKIINDIAYLIYDCYEHREILFINLNQEKLTHYIDLAEKQILNNSPRIAPK